MIDPLLRQKVEQTAIAAAHRMREVDLGSWWDRLRAAARMPDAAERIKAAKISRWAGAVPTWEPVDLAHSTEAGHLDVVGVDGSQIYPPERSPIAWAYVQAVAYRKSYPPLHQFRFIDIGTQMAESSDLTGEIYQHHDELNALVDAWRTLLEMNLASLASAKHLDTLTLLDGGLLPWLSVAGKTGQKYLSTYLRDLLAVRPALIAAVVSGPQSRSLARFVTLMEAGNIQDGIAANRDAILDTALMQFLLKDGQRSALFLHGSPRNDFFARSEAAVYFFFVRLTHREIARIEIPEWVAKDAHQVNVVHESVLQDARPTGYPYVLAQAHYQAVVPAEIAQIMQSRGLASYWAELGQVQRQSAKVLMKTA